MDDDFARYEECEMAEWSALFHGADRTTIELAGMRMEEVGGGLLLIAANADWLALNRAFGLGIREPVAEAQIDAVIARFRAANPRRFMIQHCPFAMPSEIPLWLERRGLRPCSHWIRLRRDPRIALPEAPCDLTIREIGPERAEAFAAIIAEGYLWPPEIVRVVAASIGRPGWHHYLAFDGDTPAAAGAWYEGEGIAKLCFTATRRAFQSRGAQKALIVRRLRDAADAGFRAAISEVVAPLPKRPSFSYQNQMKLGFEAAYEKTNYVWRRRRMAKEWAAFCSANLVRAARKATGRAT